MPYTEAVMHELLRITSVTSGGILHCTTEKVRFEGYDLPKGTIILPNLYGCQHNEATWGDPDVFRPERWLNDDASEFVRDERSIPFSVGKRICPAEHLVSAETLNSMNNGIPFRIISLLLQSFLSLFTFFTSLIQTFDFEATDAGLPTLDAKPGLVLHPQAYEVVLRLRDWKWWFTDDKTVCVVCDGHLWVYWNLKANINHKKRSVLSLCVEKYLKVINNLRGVLNWRVPNANSTKFPVCSHLIAPTYNYKSSISSLWHESIFIVILSTVTSITFQCFLLFQIDKFPLNSHVFL